MNLDDLFGDGAALGDDMVVKAQLRFRVHPPDHPVAQDIVDRLVVAYDERLELICEEVADVLAHADVRRSVRSQPLVLNIVPDVMKANSVVAPGTKGGKWYRDGQGKIRYGDKPQGSFKQKANSAQVAPHLEQYRPRPFMGMSGIDKELTGFLADRGTKHGLRPNEMRFLTSWYGTPTKSGDLFNAFLECAGLTPEDLRGDVSQLRFGAQKLTYEEAVFEFFAAQRALFMGEESDDEDPEGEWNHILNDQLKPLLDSVFSKYEALKETDEFKERYSEEGDRQRRVFYDTAKRCADATNEIATHITAGWDPEKQVAEVLSGLKLMGLFHRPSAVDSHAHVHGRPHLEGAVMLDERLLVDDEKSNPLLAKEEKLASLTVSQLMLLYVAAELARRWDPDSRSYSTEPQEDIGPGALGEAAFTTIGEISTQWCDASRLARQHLDRVVDRLVATINEQNSDTGSEDGDE